MVRVISLRAPDHIGSFSFLLSFIRMPPERSLKPETRLSAVYLFCLNGNGEEVGEPIKIGLLTNGTADLSMIPSGLRETWNNDGISDALGLIAVYPKNGEAFLRALLLRSNGYERYRSSPKKI